MKTDIWMPMYVADYLADTSRLTTEQHGAYLLLIFDYWRSGPLPDDNEVLARITKMSPDAWSNAQVVLRPFFRIGEDGRLRHKRIDAELSRASANRAVATDKARKAAEARWAKDAPSMLQALPEAMPEQCPSPSPSPSPSPTPTKSESTSKQKPLAQSAEALHAVVQIPLIGNSTYPVTEEQVAQWAALYPAVDVEQELRKMVGWHDSHPRNRKTPRGIKGSITAWLAKEQDKARVTRTGNSQAAVGMQRDGVPGISEEEAAEIRTRIDAKESITRDTEIIKNLRGPALVHSAASAVVDRVVMETGISGEKLRAVLEDVAKYELRDRSADDVVAAIAGAIRGFLEAKRRGRLSEFASGIVGFFADGKWRDEDLWDWSNSAKYDRDGEKLKAMFAGRSAANA